MEICKLEKHREMLGNRAASTDSSQESIFITVAVDTAKFVAQTQLCYDIHSEILYAFADVERLRIALAGQPRRIDTLQPVQHLFVYARLYVVDPFASILRDTLASNHVRSAYSHTPAANLWRSLPCFFGSLSDGTLLICGSILTELYHGARTYCEPADRILRITSGSLVIKLFGPMRANLPAAAINEGLELLHIRWILPYCLLTSTKRLAESPDASVLISQNLVHAAQRGPGICDKVNREDNKKPHQKTALAQRLSSPITGSTNILGR